MQSIEYIQCHLSTRGVFWDYIWCILGVMRQHIQDGPHRSKHAALTTKFPVYWDSLVEKSRCLRKNRFSVYRQHIQNGSQCSNHEPLTTKFHGYQHVYWNSLDKKLRCPQKKIDFLGILQSKIVFFRNLQNIEFQPQIKQFCKQRA